MHNPFAYAARLVWPTSCPSCAAPGRWCEGCQPRRPPTLLHAGHPVVAVDGYEPVLGAVIRAWKLGGRHDLTGPLAVLLAGAVRYLSGPYPPVLVPVPARPSSLRRRGADLVAELAADCSREGGWRWARPLRWRREVAEQVGAPADGRRTNLLGSMRAERIRGAPVVVIDDVRTTGATLDAAFTALREAGCAPIGGAVLAAANLSDPVLRGQRAGG